MVKENRLVQTFIDMASISSPSLKERSWRLLTKSIKRTWDGSL